MKIFLLWGLWGRSTEVELTSDILGLSAGFLLQHRVINFSKHLGVPLRSGGRVPNKITSQTF